LPGSCQYRGDAGEVAGESGRCAPGEVRARAALVAACVAALAFLASGCWSDPASMEACKRACAPRPVAKLSSDGCVCQAEANEQREALCARIFLGAIDSGRGLQPHDCKFFRDSGCRYQCGADAGAAR
jgi:hypothetical protein